VKEKSLRELLIKLIERQKIACSKTCVAKYAVEGISVEETISSIEAYYKKRRLSEGEIDEHISHARSLLLDAECKTADKDEILDYLNVVATAIFKAQEGKER